MWKSIVIECSIAIAGIALLLVCRQLLRGKGVAEKLITYLEKQSKWKERGKGIFRKIRKFLQKIDKHRRKIYVVMMVGVMLAVIMSEYVNYPLNKETINLQSRQYYVWWYENKYENDWINMDVTLTQGGIVVYFHTTNIEFVNWVENGYVLLDEVEGFRVTEESFNETFRLAEKESYFFVYYSPEQEEDVEIILDIKGSGVKEMFWMVYITVGVIVASMVYEGSRYVYILNKERDKLEERVKELERRGGELGI